MISIRLATMDDHERIMRFIGVHWRNGHILSTDTELFLYEFQDGDALNFAIAADGENLVGLFGFMRYGPTDLAGSFWKALEVPGEPMLGIKLRNFVMENVPHRFFAAPGANIQTKPIYQYLGMNWFRMEHYYWLNPNLTAFTLATVPAGHPLPGHRIVQSTAMRKLEDVGGFPFEAFSDIAPFKDWHYVAKRFFRHPIYHYDVFEFVHDDGAPPNLAVCRRVEHQGRAVLRIVDFYGREGRLADVLRLLQQVVIDNDCEYLDFVCTGFDPDKMAEAGMTALDFDGKIVIPNYFEPFVLANVPVYCVADKLDGIRFRQCRADGDQDRPNRR